MTEELTRELVNAVELARDEDPADPESGRRLRLRIMPWDVTAITADSGPESFARGAFADVDPSRVVIESQRHDGPAVGRGTKIEELDDAAYLDAVIARTRDGDELLELYRAGVVRDVSVLFTPRDGGTRRRRDGVTERTRADLRRVAVLAQRGAYQGAEVVSARHREEPPAMTTEALPAAPELTLEAITSAVRGIVTDEMPAPTVSVPSPAPSSVLLERAATFGELYQRVYDGDTELARALADEVTSDVPSLVRPAWLDKIVGLLPDVRPIVSAFGRGSLPADGMAVNWPTFDGDYTGRVGVQATQKTDIVSKKIVLDSESVNIVTYAGGLDISWQTLRRSAPSFRDIALRILTTAWAQVTDDAFGDAVTAGATGTGAFPATPDADAIHTTLVAASAEVDDATGAPATFVLAAPDAWLAIATVPGMRPTTGNPQNASGSATASTLRVEASGLPIIRAKMLAAGTVLVSNGLAAAWLEDGMFTAAQDVVAKLGTDVAVWSLGAPALYIPTGIVKLTGAPVIPFSAPAKSSTKSTAS